MGRMSRSVRRIFCRCSSAGLVVLRGHVVEEYYDFVIKLFEIDLLQIILLNLLEIVEYEDTFCFW